MKITTQAYKHVTSGSLLSKLKNSRSVDLESKHRLYEVFIIITPY